MQVFNVVQVFHRNKIYCYLAKQTYLISGLATIVFDKTMLRIYEEGTIGEVEVLVEAEKEREREIERGKRQRKEKEKEEEKGKRERKRGRKREKRKREGGGREGVRERVRKKC